LAVQFPQPADAAPWRRVALELKPPKVGR